MKKFIEFIICCIISLIILYILYINRNYIFNQTKDVIKVAVNDVDTSSLIENTIISLSADDTEIKEESSEPISITLKDISGNKTKYSFEYNSTTFYATYTPDNWHIDDSYKIKDSNAIKKICEELIKIHPIHSKDMESYRTVEDLSYEWTQHNLAYEFLPEDNVWKDNAKDVDLDPEDQNLTYEEMYERRTGEKIDYNKIKDKAKSKIKNKLKNNNTY